MRSRHVLILLAAAWVVGVAPALAANQSVTATPSNQFAPANVTVNPGETVTWTNSGGVHNVKFDDGSFEQPADPSTAPWTVSRSFDTPGTFRYYCELHGGPNGVGMSGTVTVGGNGGAPGGSNSFSFGGAKKNKKRGTAKLTVSVPGPGDVRVAETKKVKGTNARAEAAGEVVLSIRPTDKTKEKLGEGGSAKVQVQVTYTPDGGVANTQTETLKLIKRR
jgi:plastocyanin